MKTVTPYRGEQLNRIAFPLGGLGAGMIALEGTGAFSHVSLRHKPEVFNEPLLFAALHVKGAPSARVLEGPVPMWKAFGAPGAGGGTGGKSYGLPRFASATFTAHFPFGVVALRDKTLPVTSEITGWSPFIPNDADNSGLPVCAVEYRFQNTTCKAQRAVFSFHAGSAVIGSGAKVLPVAGGFAFAQPPTEGKPWDEGHFTAFTTDRSAQTDCAWFRGTWFDPLTMLWQNVAAGRSVARGPHADGVPGAGGSLFVPFTLQPGASKTIRVLLAWYVPVSDLRCGTSRSDGYRPWYAKRFAGLPEVANYWRENYDRLRSATRQFTDCFYDTTLPAEVVDAVAANLTILKSPTCLRQFDGRFWGWEGCSDASGCCHGTCTHVWNYAQALAHLFPALERTLRETEFGESQNDRGHQNFRTALPIQLTDHDFHAAADGQLGGIVKMYRDWRISGDTDWLKTLWPRVRQSLEYCSAQWDPQQTGTLTAPHHNTYDIEFWGADGMCTSFYLAALQAAIVMGRECNENVSQFEELLARGRRRMERELWNGEYFFQKVAWTGDPTQTQSCATKYSPEALVILKKEGPKYQYGRGCLSDGVLGDWLGQCAGLPSVLPSHQIAAHLAAVFAHNYRKDLRAHANPQRPGYALGNEGGLVLCSWPRGGKPALPFPYSDEVWTGIEYSVASHLIMLGRVREGLQIVRTARARYDGRYRNPFNEYECGHWYARALSSYALLPALSGARYDAVEKTLHLSPTIKGNFRAFLCTATGYGTVGRRNGQVFLDVVAGTIPLERMNCKK